MTHKQQLIELRDKVRAGTYDAGEACDLFHASGACWKIDAAYSGSLDAARALHNALLPGFGYGIGPWGARVWLYSDNPEWDGSKRQEVELIDHPARAWLLAILSALIEAEP